MKLYDLGWVPWLDSQLLYHALARLGREGLVLCRPSSPYVCIGRHQDLALEVDTEYCRSTGIPVFRREVGGGAVFLDGDQLFYQVIVSRDSPLVPGDRLAFYERFLAPVQRVYRRIGIPASYKPVNDLMVGGRKISGNGVAEIGDMVVFVGNLIADFDYDTMVHVLRVPDEKFRDKVGRSMRENLTTIKRELGAAPAMSHLRALLVSEFEGLLGRLEPAGVDGEWRQAANEVARDLASEAWLSRGGRAVKTRVVRVSASATVRQGAWKAPGGLIRATSEVVDGRLASVEFSGDFFVYPAERLGDLERALAEVEIASVPAVLDGFMCAHPGVFAGVAAGDLAKALGLS